MATFEDTQMDKYNRVVYSGTLSSINRKKTLVDLCTGNCWIWTKI